MPHAENPKSKYCGTCAYKSNYIGSCDYFLITGNRRPCTAGKGCTVRTDSANRRSRGKKQPKWDTKRGYELFQKGLTDQQIAERLGTSSTAVNAWRRRHWSSGPPATGPKPKRKTTREIAEA